MSTRARALWAGVALAAGVAAGVVSCSESFKPGDDTGGASGAAGDEQGGVSGTSTSGASGASTSGTGGAATGGSGTAGGEAGAGAEPTGGTGNGGANGGTGGDQPEGGTGGSAGRPTYPSIVLADEPLAYWRMGIANALSVPNEAGGDNALLLQGTGHELGRPGAIRDDDDTAIGFDGVASFAIATNPREFDFTERAPFTLECWALRLTGGASYFQHVMSNVVGNAGTRDGYSLYLLPEPTSGEDARTTFEYDRPGDEVSLWGPMPAEATWAHYVVTFDGAQAILYVNGTLESTQPIAGAFAARTGPFGVARAATAARDYFKGVLDEVAVYPRALGVGEVVEHFAYRAP
jgi:hypothetical protein